ncbi:MAG TPA: hypothetical protein VGB75_05465 [Jatrophihabitans sp.]|jgi:hypothetical protein|uniref:hypothetical protein n=1 Tax=Jatrophihabitans sp. TaxID=1932789 RepID=UPI002EE4CA25
MSSSAQTASCRAAGLAQRLARFGCRRPATLVWLLLYAVVAALAPSPASLLVTAALVGVLVLRLRLAERLETRIGR